MRLKFLPMAALLALFAFTFTSCSDDDSEDEPEQEQEEQTENTPEFEGADATLVAITSQTITDTPIGPVAINIGTAVGAFFEAGSENLVDVGTVAVNSSTLTKQSNNSYVYMPSATEIEGISFTGGTNWEVEGGNGFPAISASPGFTFPTTGQIISAETVTKASGYTVTVDWVTAADSIIYNIGGITKTTAGNVLNCEFSSEDLSSVSTGTNVVQAAAYAYSSEEFSGKNVYFVKEFVASKTVTVE